MRKRRRPKSKSAVELSSRRLKLSVTETDASRGRTIKELSENSIVLEIECGPHKAKFYLDKVQMGSKGQCVFFEDSWLTPNEFQLVSGRETTRDWKRSIKHHDKSLKLLMSRGLLSLSPAECRCEHCVGEPHAAEVIENSELENVPPEPDGSSYLQRELDSPSKRDVVEQESNQALSKIAKIKKHKVKKRRRDKSPKSKGKLRSKKQWRSRASSEGMKNILKLKRVEDSEEYVSSVIWSHKKCDNRKVAEEHNEVRENDTSKSGIVGNLRAYEEDTANYDDETDDKGEEIEEMPTSNQGPGFQEDFLKNLIPPKHVSTDGRKTEVSLLDQTFLDAEEVNTNDQSPSPVVGHVLSTEQQGSVEIIKGSAKISIVESENDTEPEEHASGKPVRNIDGNVDVVVKVHSMATVEKPTLPIAYDSSSYDANSEKGVTAETSTNTVLGSVEDGTPRTSVSSKNKREMSLPSDEFMDAKLSPKKKCRLTRAIEQLKTDNCVTKMNSKGKDSLDGGSSSAPIPDKSFSSFQVETSENNLTSDSVRRTPFSESPILSSVSDLTSITPSTSSPQDLTSIMQSPISPTEPLLTKSPSSPQRRPHITQPPVSPHEPRSSSQTNSPPRELPSTKQTLNMKYYRLLKSHAEAMRKAEAGTGKFISNKWKDDPNDMINTSSSPRTTPLSDASSDKQGGVDLSINKPGLRNPTADIPTRTPVCQPGYGGGNPSHLGVPYMPYPYYLPAMGPTTGLPTTGMLPKADPVLYRPLYGIHPSMPTGGPGTVELRSDRGLGFGPVCLSSTHGNASSGIFDQNSNNSAMTHITESNHLISGPEQERVLEANTISASYCTTRHSLPAIVDLPRKVGFAYDQSGAFDLTSSVKRSAEEFTTTSTAKKSRALESHQLGSLESTGYWPRNTPVKYVGHREGHHGSHNARQLAHEGPLESHCVSYHDDHGKSYREDRLGNRSQRHSQCQNHQILHKTFFRQMTKPNIQWGSLDSAHSSSSSSTSNVTLARVARHPTAPETCVLGPSLPATVPSAQSASFAHGYPSGSPYAAARHCGKHPSTLGLMQHPTLYPFPV